MIQTPPLPRPLLVVRWTRVRHGEHQRVSKYFVDETAARAHAAKHLQLDHGPVVIYITRPPAWTELT